MVTSSKVLLASDIDGIESIVADICFLLRQCCIVPSSQCECMAPTKRQRYTPTLGVKILSQNEKERKNTIACIVSFTHIPFQSIAFNSMAHSFVIKSLVQKKSSSYSSAAVESTVALTSDTEVIFSAVNNRSYDRASFSIWASNLRCCFSFCNCL